MSLESQKTVGELREHARSLSDGLEFLETSINQLQTSLDQVQRQASQLAGDLDASRSERQELEGQLQELRKLLQEYESRIAELVGRGERQASEWSSRRQALASEIALQSQEMEQVRAELRQSQERERNLQGRLNETEEARIRERNRLGQELARAQQAGPAYQLTDQQSHDFNTNLNLLLGFSGVLVEDREGTTLTVEERREFIEHVNATARRLAEGIVRLTATTPDARSALRSSDRGPARVLIADRDQNSWSQVEPFARAAGYELSFVTSTEQLIGRALQTPPLAVIVDAKFVAEGGNSLVSLLRRDPRSRDIALVLTSRSEKDQVGSGQGQAEFLPKPIDRHQLLQLLVRIDLLADGKRARKMPSSILVIDDDRLAGTLVKAIVKPYKIEVIRAERGKAGIEIAAKRKPELVMIDLVMPEMDGFQVVEALRKGEETSDIPILVYTAKPLTREDRERLRGKVQATAVKGEVSHQDLLELLFKRGERRNRRVESTPSPAA